MGYEDLRFATCVRCGGPFVFAREGALVCATVISKYELETNNNEQLKELVKVKLEMATENIMDKITAYKDWHEPEEE